MKKGFKLVLGIFKRIRFFRVTFVNCIFSCVMHNVYVTEIYLPVRVTPFIDTCYSNVLNS